MIIYLDWSGTQATDNTEVSDDGTGYISLIVIAHILSFPSLYYLVFLIICLRTGMPLCYLDYWLRFRAKL